LNVFDEFKIIAKKFQESQLAYALIGGVAMAFHGEPRFTKDIDFLIEKDALETICNILTECGYFKSSEPWTFRNTHLTLHRFAKAFGEDIFIIDVLVAGEKRHRKIIKNALRAKSENGIVFVAQKEDLIWMKQIRNSKQDQADIERLEK
jgi:nucleotidyltransferase AbiEii toxin of type IV toxin-antitoxin system